SINAGRNVSQPITSAHAPLTAIDQIVIRSRPSRSAHFPASTEPTPPAAITQNATTPARAAAPASVAPRAAKKSKKNTATSDQQAYNSHMWLAGLCGDNNDGVHVHKSNQSNDLP